MTEMLKSLEQLYKSREYPLHMPGHKRKPYIDSLAGAYAIDITEIEGYDNLYEPEGMIKEALEFAKNVYGSDETMFLVNGSTVGILSAIAGVASDGGKLLVARNCHKAVFHGVELCRCDAVYLHPVWDKEWDILTEITVEEVKEKLKKNRDVKAVVITSPTYEGQVSDIEKIAKEVHEYHIPLIVDEAHGAHFIYDSRFPQSAIELGADVVIQSMHKTLPCFTQTALLHMKKGYIDIDRMKEFVGYFQTSSPSYLFMASMDHCIRDLAGRRQSPWEEMFSERHLFLEEAKKLHHIRVKEDTEPCKLLVSVKNTGYTGRDLQKRLLEEYQIQIEMACDSYIVAIITAWDCKEGCRRLLKALQEIDSTMTEKRSNTENWAVEEEIVYSQYQAGRMQQEFCTLQQAEGKVSGRFVNLYPPGTPIVAPGERLTKNILSCISDYLQKGLSLQGLSADGKIAVCKEPVR